MCCTILAAPLYLKQTMVVGSTVSTFRSMCAVANVAVFCSTSISCFPGMLLVYFPNDFQMVPVASIITGINFGFTFHMHCIYVLRSLYFRIL
jgi:hypothetical protein